MSRVPGLPDDLRHGNADSDGVRIHYAEYGPEDGPAVLLVHGFPELAYSWRRQLPALAGAGYRAVVVDTRGNGRSAKPVAVEDYRMLCYVADNVAVAEALGVTEVAVVGHDWGSPIAAHSALLRPDLFSAAALLSVPYTPPSVRQPTKAFAEMAGADHEFYINYFQEPGRAEAEADADVARWLGGFYWGGSGEGARSGGANLAVFPKGERMVDHMPVKPSELSFLPEEEFEVYVAEFERTGFSGGLNRYRNVDRDWADLAALRGRPLVVPSLFIGGELDGPTVWGADAIRRFPTTMPGLVASHILPGCGHWVQQEQADEVNRLLLEWLGEVRPV